MDPGGRGLFSSQFHGFTVKRGVGCLKKAKKRRIVCPVEGCTNQAKGQRLPVAARLFSSFDQRSPSFRSPTYLHCPPIQSNSLQNRRRFLRGSLRVASRHGSAGCGADQSGGRRGFQPPHKANRINEGFSPGGARPEGPCIRARLQSCRKQRPPRRQPR